MKSFWMKTAMSAACALAFAGAANAAVMDFESVDLAGAPFAPLLADGDYVTQGGYFANTQSVVGGGLVGQLSNGGDAGSCLDGACPTGNLTNFLSVYDDGVLHVGRLDGAKITFSGASFAFLKAIGDPAATTLYMAVEADRSDGSYAAWAFPISASGSFATITTASTHQVLGGTGTLTSGDVTDLFFYGYYCNPSTGGCSAFNTNKAQFAIDNITVDVAAVPEPSEWLLMVAGLGAIGAVRRRRSAA